MTLSIKRREFLFGIAGGMSSVYVMNSLPFSQLPVPQARADLLDKSRHALVVVFLRGGFDGLSLICPTEGQDRRDYESARPHLGLPLTGPMAALRLDDRFAINSAAQPLQTLFNDKRLAFIQACGLPVPSRSHFAAQTLMELGVSRTGEDKRGWLTRFIEQVPCKAAAVGALRPTSLQGAAGIMAFARLKGLGLEGSSAQQVHLRSALRRLYGEAGQTASFGQTALNMLDELEDIGLRTRGKDKSDLPSGEIAQKFAITAQLLQRDEQLQLVTLDIGGWDTHRQQGNIGDGYFAKQLGLLSRALADFYQQMLTTTNAWVTTVVMSEFGRRLKENGNRGTDHGHGNLMMVLGPRIRGGVLHGRWPGLANENLFERADLAVTTDSRLVLHRCLQTIAPQLTLNAVFPRADASSASELNLLP